MTHSSEWLPKHGSLHVKLLQQTGASFDIDTKKPIVHNMYSIYFILSFL